MHATRKVGKAKKKNKAFKMKMMMLAALNSKSAAIVSSASVSETDSP